MAHVQNRLMCKLILLESPDYFSLTEDTEDFK